MNENQELSPETIRILYKDCLYKLEDKPSIPLPQSDTNVAFNTANEKDGKTIELPSIRKKFVVVTDSAIVQNNSDLRFKFLSEIIRACKLTMEEGVITDVGMDGKDYHQLLQKFQPDVFLLFGIGPSDVQLPMIFPQFQVQRIGNQTYISAPALELLEPDKTSKSKLWSCLKQAFSI